MQIIWERVRGPNDRMKLKCNRYSIFKIKLLDSYFVVEKLLFAVIKAKRGINIQKKDTVKASKLALFLDWFSLF